MSESLSELRPWAGDGHTVHHTVVSVEQFDLGAVGGDRGAGQQDGAAYGDADGGVRGVDGADEAGAGEDQQPLGGVQPLHRGARAESGVHPAGGDRGPVQLQGGAGLAGLGLDAQLAPARGLRQPAAARAEAVRAALAGPRDRHPAPVAEAVLALGPEERRVLAGLVRQLRDVGQAELLALVDVGGAGQRQHQQGGRAGAAQAKFAVARGTDLGAEAGRVGEPGGVPGDVVVGEHPGGGGADRAHRVQRGVDDLAERLGVPGGGQVLEVEGLVHLVGAHVVGGALDGRGPGLGDRDPPTRRPPPPL